MKKLCRLPVLKRLWLPNNQLTNLPTELDRVTSLTELNVMGNRDLQLEQKIFQGAHYLKLLGWLKQFEAGTVIQSILKVLLVGEGNNNQFEIMVTYLPIPSSLV